MTKSMNSSRFESFLLASLGVHVLLFFTLSNFLGETTKPFISRPHLEIQLFSFTSPAIAHGKPFPKVVSPPKQGEAVRALEKVWLPDPPQEEIRSSMVHMDVSQLIREDPQQIPPEPEEKVTEESTPVFEGHLAMAPPFERKDKPHETEEESFWIEGVTPSDEPSSLPAIASLDHLSPSTYALMKETSVESGASMVTQYLQEAASRILPGVSDSSLKEPMEKKNVQMARPVAPLEGETTLVHPRYLINPKPVYPPEAKRKGYEGEVSLRVEVLASGVVGQIEIKRSSGHEILDRAALAAVKQWRFIPAQRGKDTIPLWVNIPIKFKME